MKSGVEGVNNVNTSFSLIDDTGSGYLFNRLVNVDAIESVTVLWNVWADGVNLGDQEFVYTR